MGLLIIIAGGILAAILVSTLRTSETRSARALVREVSLWPNQDAPQADHRAAAVRLGLCFALAWVVAFGFLILSDRWPADSSGNTAFTFGGVLLFFAGFWFLWLTIRELVRGFRAPPNDGA